MLHMVTGPSTRVDSMQQDSTVLFSMQIFLSFKKVSVKLAGCKSITVRRLGRKSKKKSLVSMACIWSCLNHTKRMATGGRTRMFKWKTFAQASSYGRDTFSMSSHQWRLQNKGGLCCYAGVSRNPVHKMNFTISLN